jgi:hypothetical protein
MHIMVVGFLGDGWTFGKLPSDEGHGEEDHKNGNFIFH